VKKAYLFWPIAGLIVLLDFLTKRAALNALQYGEPREVIGNYVRFTLGYNPGIAFGLSQYDSARPLLIIFTIIAVAGILWIYRTTDPAHKVQIVALGFILGGAIGNLLDRFQRAKGVADFIDVGIGSARFWTFNVADAAITTGAVLLILSSLIAGKEPVKQA
jgi:signal peptidase II